MGIRKSEGVRGRPVMQRHTGMTSTKKSRVGKSIFRPVKPVTYVVYYWSPFLSSGRKRLAQTIDGPKKQWR